MRRILPTISLGIAMGLGLLLLFTSLFPQTLGEAGLEWLQAGRLVRGPDGTRRYAPDYRGWIQTSEGRYTFRTDSEGYRNDAWLVQPDWLLVGDSMTVGYVDQNKTWAHLLEAGWAPLRIYNLGVEGQGTLQHLSRLKEALEGKRMRPGRVLWAFYPNDPSDDRRFLGEKERLHSRTILQGWSAWLQRHLPLCHWMRHSLWTSHSSPREPPFLGTYQDELKHAGKQSGYPTLAKAVVSHWYSVRTFGEANSNQSRQDWALTETGLNQAWELLRTRGIPMTLVYMTPQLLLIEEECRNARPELFGTQPAENFREALETWARTHHVPLLDPTDAFRKAQQRGEILYWVRDGHWNEHGNEVLADWLLTHLTAQQEAQHSLFSNHRTD